MEALIVVPRTEPAHTDQSEKQDHDRNSDPMFSVKTAQAADDGIDISRNFIRHTAPGSSATQFAESTP